MTFSESLANATKQGVCFTIDSFAKWAALHERLFGRLDPLPSAANYWRALNRDLCNKEQPGGEPPIEGGQCEAQYEVTTFWDSSTGFTCVFQTRSIVRTVWGPITDITLTKDDPEQTTNASWTIELVCRGSGAQPTAPGTKVLVSNFTNGGSSCRDPQILDVQFARVDGLPDDCQGFIPPPPPPPGWNQIIINNFTWINNNGDTINEGDLNLELGFAYIDLDFDVKIPVKVDVGGINFNGTFNFDKGAFELDFSRDITNNFGDINIRPPGGPNEPLPPGLPGTPDNGDDIEPDPDVREDDDEEEGEQEGESRIVAARVVVSSVNNESIGTFLQNRNPDIAIPNYGYIQFFIPTEGSVGAWTSDIPVKNANHFIPCPWPDGATAVRGTPRRGVFWSIQALRTKISTKIVYP